MVRVSTCSESNTFHQKEIPDNDNIGKTTTLTLHLEKIMPILAIMARDYCEGNFEFCSNLSVFHTAHRFDHNSTAATSSFPEPTIFWSAILKKTLGLWGRECGGAKICHGSCAVKRGRELGNGLNNMDGE